MTKHVFPNRQVAHVWAAQTQANGRSNNGQFYFDGATIYSYRSNWPIGVITGIVTPEGKRVVVMNAERYGVTTSRHLSLAQGGLHGHSGYEVIGSDSCQTVRLFDRNQWNTSDAEAVLKAKRALLSERIVYLQSCAERCAKPHLHFNPYRWGEQWEGHLDECAYRLRILEGKARAINNLADLLGVQSSDIPPYDLKALTDSVRMAYAAFNDPKRVKARESAKRKRKLAFISSVYAKAWGAKDSELWQAYEDACTYRPSIAANIGRDIQSRLYDRECKATLEARFPDAWHVVWERRNYGASSRKTVTPIEWMNGANGSIAFDPNERTPRDWQYPTLVRRVGDRVETSRGAEVPFKAAVGLYQLAASVRRIGKPIKSEGGTDRVGAFHLQAIDAEGNCTVGCHHLQFSEMERLAVREVPALVKARYPLPAIIGEVR